MTALAHLQAAIDQLRASGGPGELGAAHVVAVVLGALALCVPLDAGTPADIVAARVRLASSRGFAAAVADRLRE